MQDANAQLFGRPKDAGPCVLIVEDERGLRRSLATYLGRKGARLVEVGSLESASAALRGQIFDVLILDVGLPDGCGLTLLETVPADRCLVISANPNPESFASAGVLHWLSKPLDLGIIWSIVHRLATDHQACSAPA